MDYTSQLNDVIFYLSSTYTRLDDTYKLLAVVLAVCAATLAYLMIKNWRFK